MTLKSRIQQFLTHWKDVHYSILIVPNAGGSMKQVRIQALYVFAALFLVVSAGLFLVASTVILIKSGFQMQTINQDITQASTQQQEQIAALQAANDQLGQENKKLKASTELSAEYINRRSSDLDKLKAQVDTLLVLLNKDAPASARVQTSRGGPRLSMDTYVPTLTASSTLEELEAKDEFTRALQSDLEKYSKIVAELQKEVDAREAKPDLRPAFGVVTSPFGYRDDPMGQGTKFHQGIDIDNGTGTPIKAAGAGVVISAGYDDGGYGNTVVINHGNGYKTVYAHLDTIRVKAGQKLEKGQQLGTMGSSGRSTGSHLHFEMHLNGSLIDPLSVLRSR